MADLIISKHKFRKGSNDQRKTIIFDQGEPAYTIDTKRFYIGTGTLSGGSVIGSKFHPILLNYYSLSTTIAEVNDIVVAENEFYQLTAVDYSNINSWANISPIVDNDATTKFRSSSANWEQTYNTVTSNSANWNSTYTTVQTNSALWSGVDIDSTSLTRTFSANWNSTYDIVYNNSSLWNSTYFTLASSTPVWDYAYNSVVLGQNNWNSTYTTVQANSAYWESNIFDYKELTTEYTVLSTDHVLNCTANSFTIILPLSAGAGKTVIVKNSSAGTITLSGSGGQLIDGGTTATIIVPESISLISTGNGWIVV